MASLGARVHCVLYVIGVLTRLAWLRALCACVLGVLHEMSCLARFKKLACLACFIKWSVWLGSKNDLPSVLLKIPCLACFIKWRVWRAT